MSAWFDAISDYNLGMRREHFPSDEYRAEYLREMAKCEQIRRIREAAGMELWGETLADTAARDGAEQAREMAKRGQPYKGE